MKIITFPLPGVKRGTGKLIDEVLNKTAAVFFDENIKWDGYLKGGEDWNAWAAAYMPAAFGVKRCVQQDFLIKGTEKVQNRDPGEVLSLTKPCFISTS